VGRYTGKLVFGGEAAPRAEGYMARRYGDPRLTRGEAKALLRRGQREPLLSTLEGTFTLPGLIQHLASDSSGAHRMQSELLRAGGGRDPFGEAGRYKLELAAAPTVRVHWSALGRGRWGDSWSVPVTAAFDLTMTEREVRYVRPSRARVQEYLGEMQTEAVMAAGGWPQAIAAFYAQPQWLQMEQLEAYDKMMKGLGLRAEYTPIDCPSCGEEIRHGDYGMLICPGCSRTWPRTERTPGWEELTEDERAVMRQARPVPRRR